MVPPHKRTDYLKCYLLELQRAEGSKLCELERNHDREKVWCIWGFVVVMKPQGCFGCKLKSLYSFIRTDGLTF